MINNNLKKDYLYCRNIINKNSKTFSVAFSMLPSPKKEAVWSLYAFNRRLDDIADEKRDVEALNEEKKHFENLIKGIVLEHPIYRTLQDVNGKFTIDVNAVNAMFEGQYHDLNFKPFNTDDDLIKYCYNVAGSVGHMLLPIVATKNADKLYESAKYIGIAMQLTNILRDVGEDYRNNRVYLSKEQINFKKVDLEYVMKYGATYEYKQIWEHYAEMASEFYNLGLKDIDLYDEDSRFIIKAAAVMYSKIIDAVKSINYDFNKKAFVPYKEKVNILTNIN